VDELYDEVATVQEADTTQPYPAFSRESSIASSSAGDEAKAAAIPVAQEEPILDTLTEVDTREVEDPLPQNDSSTVVEFAEDEEIPGLSFSQVSLLRIPIVQPDTHYLCRVAFYYESFRRAYSGT
jgi:hypothetical protein